MTIRNYGKIKKFLKISLMILSLWLFFTLWWYYAPHKMLNVSYKTNKNILEDLDQPVILIVSHTYMTPDIILMCNETRKLKLKTNIISEKKEHFNVNQFFKDFPMFTHYNRLDIYENKKNNTTKLLTEKLKNKENVLIFFNKDKNNSGIYHILKETKVPILFTKIYRQGEDIKNPPKNKNHLTNIFGNNYNIDYQLVKDYNLDKDPKKFISWVKEKLYN